MQKTYKILYSHQDRCHKYEGTIEHLVEHVFGYTLECGHSWNSKIPLKPKTAKSLVKALNDSAEVCRHYSDYYKLG